MSVKTRLKRLEQRSGGGMRIEAIALEVPGAPDMMLVRGEWQEVPDGTDLRTLSEQAMKVYIGLDLREV